ncbi:alpha/beta fold hydrolase [Kribbella sp. NPDC050470]|uniref:alpha/beta fold hydrolase n=1 Tax=unclassified Kribbella TaxID=2644121 RepID=UPI0037B71B0F
MERWAILGHSAGGNYAVEYAIRHPSAVSAVIFDCPCWDFDDRHRLPIFARLYDDLGDPERAARCRELAIVDRRLTARCTSSHGVSATASRTCGSTIRPGGPSSTGSGRRPASPTRCGNAATATW